MRSYVELAVLRDVVLEESFVLKICSVPGALELVGEFVLGEGHPAYHEPSADESDCFVRGTLRFRDVSSLTWEGQGAPPPTDASGEIDYGHIDDLRWEDDVFELEGDWGQMRVVAARLDLELEP